MLIGYPSRSACGGQGSHGHSVGAGILEVQRIAAFADGWHGGNPAGVVLCEVLPGDAIMQAVAAEVGYSETAFAAPEDGGWRVRYFAPEVEVDFCGHATIALGAGAGPEERRRHLSAQAQPCAHRRGRGGGRGELLTATLQSPPTRSGAASVELVGETLALFGLSPKELDDRIPPAIAHAGADHLVLALRDRASLAAVRYDLDAGRKLARRNSIGTFSLIYAEGPCRFHARNPFPIGGVYEDPATGAAAAAFAGYLRDLGWPHGGAIEIIQGEDMGVPSRLLVELTEERGASVRVSGGARLMVAGS